MITYREDQSVKYWTKCISTVAQEKRIFKMERIKEYLELGLTVEQAICRYHRWYG